MRMAVELSALGTCPRRQVGCLIVLDGELVSSGYNGAPRGERHCTDGGCELEHGHCATAVHAELNALLQAGRRGRATAGATLYTTASPCRRCMQAVLNCGVARVVFAELYRAPSHGDDASQWALHAAHRAGVVMDHLALG